MSAGNALDEKALRRRDALLFALIAAFALALRLLYLHQARACPMFDGVVVDGESYDTWSNRLVAGDWIGDKVFYQAPLYPYFLGVVKVFVGRDLFAIRVVQCALGSVSCAILFLAVRDFVSRRAGIVAGLMLALYPSAIFFDGCVQKAGLGLLWTTLLLLALAKVARNPSPLRWFGAGAALGALMLTREETLLLVPVLGAWLVFGRRATARATRARWAAGFALGLALLLLPVAVRNEAVGGEFLISTSQAGSNFYIGNHAGSDGTYASLRPGRHNPAFERQDAFELARAEAGRDLSPKEVSDFWFAKSFAWIRSDPGEWLALLGRKTALLVNAFEVPDSEDLYFYERYAPLLRILDLVFGFGVLLPLAAAGIVTTWSRRRALLIVYLTLGTLCAGVVLFYVFARYRYPIVPFLMLFAAGGIVEAWSRVRAGRARELVFAGFVLVLAALASNVWQPWPRDQALGDSWNNSGMVQAQLGHTEEAIEMFQRAVELKPNSAENWGNWGVSLLSAKRFDDATRAFRRSLELAPADVARAHLRIGLALMGAERHAESLVEVDASLALAPTNPEALSYRANDLVHTGSHVAAVETLRALSRIVPNDAGTRARLAWILATSPDPAARNGAQALDIARALDAESHGRDPTVRSVLAAACAEAGQFDEALRIAREQQKTAETQGHADVARSWTTKLEAYEQHRPWRSSMGE